MRLLLSVVDPQSERPTCQRVLLDVDPGTTLSQVASSLRQVLGSSESKAAFAVDGMPVDGSARLGEPPLLRGAVLVLDRSGAMGRPRQTPSMLELHVVGGPGAGAVLPLRRGVGIAGRGAGCAIRLDDPGVSRSHLEITARPVGVRVRDLGPTNRSRINGLLLPPEGATLRPHDRVTLGSTTLVMRQQSTIPAATTTWDGLVRVHRRPRFVTASEPARITFPTAPPKPERARMPLVAALLPMALSALLAVVLRSPAMLLFALLTPVMLLGQWWSDRRHGRVSYRRRVVEHEGATAAAETRLAEALSEEATRRHRRHPDLAVVTRLTDRVDVRLWERRPGDDDYLRVRLGTADQPPETRVEGPRDHAIAALEAVPVVLDLVESGVLGIAGSRVRTVAAATAVLGQLAAWHSPHDLRVVLLTTDPDPERTWGWVAWLPHLAPLDEPGCLSAIGSTGTTDSVSLRVAELTTRLAARREADRTAAPAQQQPDVVVLVDGAEELRRRPGVLELLREGPAHGIRSICLDGDPERLPVEVHAQLRLGTAREPRAVLDLATGRIDGIVPDLPTPLWAERLAHAMASLTDATPRAGATALPNRLDFVAMHRDQPNSCDPLDPDAITRCWQTSDARPRALLGTTAEGPLWIDLVRDGPHVLVGGTTGSGKSELLQTLVAGLALSCRPDELGFVLIDYKGGSAFTDCARLPHVLGVVTDLDEHLTTRALTSLGAELTRRERLLARVGAKDFDDYRGRRESVAPPLGRLVLVVDEFKILADELPDFVTGLVRLAAIGRSLGVHLVLATQRPGGSISADMRANIALRIALRVRDRSDSDDLIDSPEAAAISDRTPGRARIRTAGGDLIAVQTAYAGGLAPARGVPERRPPRVWPMSWADLGCPPPGRTRDLVVTQGPTALSATVEAIRAARATLHIDVPPSPWMPPLPDVVPLGSLLDRQHDGAEPPPQRPGSVPIGLADRPQLQRQEPYTWNPDEDGHLGIAGGARTGRSTALQTIALALADRFSPAELHLHLLEGTPGSLACVARLPHVGSVTGAADPGLAGRAIARLLDQLGAGAPRARTVLLVDGWEPLTEALDDIDQGDLTEALLRLLRDGLASGLRVVVAGGRSVAAGRLASLLQRRLVLDMPDPLDLTLAGLSPRTGSARRPPGRAIDVGDETEVQLATPHRDATADPEDQPVAYAARLAAHWGPAPAGAGPWRVLPLPESVRPEQLPHPNRELLLVGLGGDDLLPQGFDLNRDERRIAVSGPPRSGRSTTLLTMARRVLDTGRTVAAVTTRRSPLAALQGAPGVHLLGSDDVEAFVALRRQHTDLAIVIDDAERLDGSPLEPALVEAARLVESAAGIVAISVDSRRAAAAYRGIIPEIAQASTGIVLQPASPADGDLFRVRVQPQTIRRPGRGLIVVDGEAAPIQVAMAALSGVAS